MSAQYGMTPLHVAIEQSQLGATRALLESGSDANARDMFGASPLHQAAAQGNQVLATLLLTYGADPWALDDGARTPPQLAARSGNQALAKLLSFYAANPRTTHALGPSPDDQTRAPGTYRDPAGIDRCRRTPARRSSHSNRCSRTQPTGQ